MRLSIDTLKYVPGWMLVMACSPIHDPTVICMLTFAQGCEIRAPIMASDGRIYDSTALITWVKKGAVRHVIPGCNIDYVDIQIRGTLFFCNVKKVMYSIVKRLHLCTCVNKKKRVSLRQRVIDYHTLHTLHIQKQKIRAPCRGSASLHHDSRVSAFRRVPKT